MASDPGKQNGNNNPLDSLCNVVNNEVAEIPISENEKSLN
jgi:hypothetical protein